MIIARQSTGKAFIVGPVLDSAGVAVTTAVIANFKLSKNGTADAAFHASASLVHNHTGYYSLFATGFDMDTVGNAEVSIDATTNSCPVKEITVVEPAVYDAIYADGAAGYVADQPVNVTKVAGEVQSAGNLAAMISVGISYIDTEVAALTTAVAGVPALVGQEIWARDDGSFFPVDTTAAQHLIQTNTNVGLIKVKTDGLPSDPADQSLLTISMAGLATDLADIQNRIPTALVSGRMNASVGAMANNVMTSLATDATFVSEIGGGGGGGGATIGEIAALFPPNFDELQIIVGGPGTGQVVANVPSLLAGTIASGGTIGLALEGALAQAYGKWVLDTTTNTLKLYAPNETTVLKTFDITPNTTTPLVRTPQ